MSKFSDRIGLTQPSNEIQFDSMNDDLKNSLWNYILETIGNGIMAWYYPLKEYYISYYKIPFDDISSDNSTCRDDLKERFYDSEWFEIYNFVEFTMQNISAIAEHNRIPIKKIEEDVNNILKRELSAYRSINLQIIPISDQIEIKSIKEAMIETDKYGFSVIKKHFENSLSLLGKKPEPDYKNSIKESISAVEGICKLLTGEKSGGIDKALNKLDKKIKLHPSFKKGITSFYGYASDEDGIRHPMLKDSDVDSAEAKFILISCTALVNFIIEKAVYNNLIVAAS